MRLNVLITAISVLAVLTLFGIFAFQTERILGDSFSELSQTQSQNLGQLVQIVFATRKDYLSNFSHVVRSDNDLASSFVLAAESKDFHAVLSRLNKIKARSGIPIIDIVSRRGNTLTNALGSFSKSVALESPMEAITSIVTVGERVLLVSYAPLKLYDEMVGVLVLGYPLDKRFADQVGKETKTVVSFSLNSSKDADENIIPLEQVGKDILFASVKADSSVVSRANAAIRTRLFKFGVVILLLFISILFASIDIGFLRHFRLILAQIAHAASQLREGKLEPLALNNHKIKELSQIASAFNQFSSSIESYDSRLRETTAAVSAAQEKAAVAETVEQVVHDLKSPLSALDKFVTAEDSLPSESKFILRGALNRITEIISDLKKGKNPDKKDKHKSPEKTAVVTQHLPTLIEELLKEKRFQYSGKQDLSITLEIDAESEELMANVDPSGFKRVISNLVDNSVHSIEKNGLVLIFLSTFQSMIEIRIVDNGKGIPEEILDKLGRKGATFGKESGSGLGLYSAKKSIDEWKGALRISSATNRGTSVRILLPKV